MHFGTDGCSHIFFFFSSLTCLSFLCVVVLPDVSVSVVPSSRSCRIVTVFPSCTYGLSPCLWLVYVQEGNTVTIRQLREEGTTDTETSGKTTTHKNDRQVREEKKKKIVYFLSTKQRRKSVGLKSYGLFTIHIYCCCFVVVVVVLGG